MESHKMNELCANLEWDAFASGAISARVEKLGDLSEDIGSVSVTRDSEYELTADISADTDGSSLVTVHGLAVVVAVDKVEIPGSNRSVTRWGIDKGIQI